jgi:competence protein ComEC
MSSPATTAPLPGAAPRLAVLGDSVWRAPLVPAALAATAGIVADRCTSLPLPVSLLALLVCLAAWAINRSAGRGLALAYLLGAIAALGAAYHHTYRDLSAPDDISQFASAEPRLARLRGVLAEEPFITRRPGVDPLRSLPAGSSTFAVLETTGYQAPEGWLAARGRVRLVVAQPLEEVHVGDPVEVTGRLVRPAGPANPGEPDDRVHLADQRIGALLLVRHTTDAILVPEHAGPWSFQRGLIAVRGWGQRCLATALPPEQAGLAMALVLGEGSSLTRADWDKYKRTGVVHLLVVSGQHLVILGAFLWFVLRCAGVRRRRSALVVAFALLGYALLTGGRPPQMRAAVMVCAATLGLILGRVALPANGFALAWLVVAVLSPTDMFTPGCQLSFLTVAVLYWIAGRSLTTKPDPLAQLTDEARPAWLRGLRWAGQQLFLAYAITLVVWLAAAPLTAANYHNVSPIGVLIGPPLAVLISIGLVAGFLLLLSSLAAPFLVPLFAWMTELSLAWGDGLVRFCDKLPGAYWYVGTIPPWWLWGFYPALLAVLFVPHLQVRWSWSVAAGLGWLCVGLAGGSAGPASGELRITFLAVGHGGCTVLETGDNRTLIYDAGAMTGPEVTAQHIAPYLWGRGVRRIDEVFLSHADLDHFNGLPALLDRFAVGQVSWTPTFAERNNTAVPAVLAALSDRGVPVRTVIAGDRLRAGDVGIDVLHPPAVGPEGRENFRSLVLRVRHRDHTVLLTGDLEGPGQEQVLELAAGPIDVLMAPHHGSKFANTPALAEWAKPRLVVSCEGPPRGPTRAPEPYTRRGIHFLGTWPHGAITVRSSAAGLTVETFRTQQRFTLRN